MKLQPTDRTNRQASRDIDQREHRSVKMPERKHQSTHFVPDVEVPANLKPVHRLENDSEEDVDREGPPAEAKMSSRVIHFPEVLAKNIQKLSPLPISISIRRRAGSEGFSTE